MGEGSGAAGAVGLTTVMDGVLPRVLGDLKIRMRIVPDPSQGTIVLPPGTAIDKPVINGTDLVLMQPDGTAVVIEDGATFPGALIVDGHAVPVGDLVAQASGSPTIEPTAPPPDGQGGPENPIGEHHKGAHPNFVSFDVSDLGPGLLRTALIDPVQMDFHVPEHPPLEIFDHAGLAPQPVAFCIEGDEQVNEGEAASYNIGYHGDVPNAGHTVSVVVTFELGDTEPEDFPTVVDTLFNAIEDAAAAADVTAENLGSGQVRLIFGPQSDTNFDFTFPTRADGVDEPNETYRLVLSDPSDHNTVLCEDVSTTIIDKDVVVFCVEGDEKVGEGFNANYDIGYHGATSLALGVTASVVVSFEFGSTEPADFVTVSDTLYNALKDAAGDAGVTAENLGNGQIRLTFDSASDADFNFQIPTFDDAQLEGAETFRLVLSDASSNAEIQCEDVRTTITDDDCIIFGITGDCQVCEGNAAQYTVNLGFEDDDRPIMLTEGQTASIDVCIDLGTAESQDFVADLYQRIGAEAAAAGVGFEILSDEHCNFRLTFSETSQVPFTFTMQTVDDCSPEGNETYNVSLEHPVSSTGCPAEIDPEDKDVDTTIIDNDQDLSGKLLINEIGVGASHAECITIGCETVHIPACEDFIEIRNFSNTFIADKSLDQVHLQISNGTDTVEIDLSTRSNDWGLQPGDSIVLFGNGQFAIYDPNGAAKQTGTFNGGCHEWPFGCDTSDKLAISMFQATCDGCISIDGFLANGACPSSVKFGDTMWIGEGQGSDCAQKLLGGLVDNNSFNGQIGNVAATVAALGLLVPTICAAEDGSTNLIYARVNAPVDQWGGPGDTDLNGNPIPADTDKAGDWTTMNHSTQGAYNNTQPLHDLNPVDSHDDLNPFQGNKSGSDIGRDPSFDGQTIANAFSGGSNEQFGSRGPDFLYSDTGCNVQHGGDHNDLLFGDGGNDVLFGEAGGDLVIDVKGSDKLYGGTGDDILITDGSQLPGYACMTEEERAHCTDVGQCGASDLLDGGAGDDILLAGTGSDKLFGGCGSDFLNGGLGSDKLEGGEGRDTFFFDQRALADVQAGIHDFICDYSCDDTIDLSSLFNVGDTSNLSDFVKLDGNKLLVDASGSGNFGADNDNSHVLAVFASAPSSINLTVHAGDDTAHVAVG